jgi:hypothetical protein
MDGVTVMPLEFRPGRPAAAPHLSELRATVRALLGLDEDTAVVIRQLACTEPGCPPLETVVAVLPMEGAARRWTLHRPAGQLTENELRAALLGAPHEGAHHP